MDRPTFSIEESDSLSRITVKLETFDFYELDKLMPFIEWYGSYVEEYPMTTHFNADVLHQNEIIRVLKGLGFVQKQSSWGRSRL